MTTTILTDTKSGAVIHSSGSPSAVEELLPFNEIIDGLISSSPTKEITVVDYGDVWYEGQVKNITNQFAEKSYEFSNTESVIYGTSRSDKIYDTSDSDTLVGGAGNDLFFCSTGEDVIYGGPGTDSVYFNTKDLETLEFIRGSDSNVTHVIENQTGKEVTLIGVENVLFFGQGYPLDLLIS
ncbi:MAG: hypothetical protein H0V39_05925 [Nitrosomonas sp.]|nr:hypothetical protein [Nitrosomonas sp.]